jgi:hypothetical protein
VVGAGDFILEGEVKRRVTIFTSNADVSGRIGHELTMAGGSLTLTNTVGQSWIESQARALATLRNTGSRELPLPPLASVGKRNQTTLYPPLRCTRLCD